MRILFLSNFYPPHVIGGYEMACGRAAAGLAARGHEIAVLTSTYGVGGPDSEGGVHRLLRIDMEDDAARRNPLARAANALRLERANQRTLRRILSGFRPDVVHVWNPRFIPTSCIAMIQRRGIPVSFFVFDHWLRYLGHDAMTRMLRMLRKAPLGGAIAAAFKAACAAAGLEAVGAPLRLDHVQFSTRFLERQARDEGIAPAHAEILYWGVEAGPASEAEAGPRGKLLFVGQMVPHKGVHRALEALRILRDRGADVSLTLVGGSADAAYQDRLRASIADADLGSRVEWLGPRPEAELPAIYRRHGILLFPSLWEEPFGITQLEAMRYGLVVVSTATGGAAEIVSHGVNGLTYDRDDPAACADRVAGLLADPALCARLAAEARRTLEAKFALEATLARMDESLSRLARSGTGAGKESA